MIEAIVCRACGAKIKAGRERCLRCGNKLEGSSGTRPTTLLTDLSSKHGPALRAGGALSLVVLLGVLGAVYLRARPSNPASISVSTSAPKPATATRAVQSAEPALEPRLLDHKLAGSVSYAQGDYAAAIDRYRQALVENPNDADTLNNLGQVLTRMGQAAEAIPYLDRARELYPNVWAYRFNLARAHGQTGDWSRAVAGYRAAQELFPDDYVTQFNLAHALHKEGHDEQAVVEYQKAITLAPGEPSFQLSLAVSYESLSRSNDAMQSYRRYLEMAPGAPEAQKVKERLQALTSAASSEITGQSIAPVRSPAE
ncbi:MAG: tetratricopeptide repeat protein [Vicinamibacterales bacterium]